MKKLSITAAAILLLSSCGTNNVPGFPDGAKGIIYPDYIGVTVPATIAPLNFSYTAPGLKDVKTVFSAGDVKVTVNGTKVCIKEKDWSKLLEAAAGGDITVSSSEMDSSWVIHVSGDEIDYGLNYRMLTPGYEVHSKMGIYERELASYSQKAILENTQFDGCVNCHAYNRGDPGDMTLHIRGSHGATLIRKDGVMQAFNTKTDSTLGFCVYPYWHPGGQFVAFSTNTTRQGFHVGQEKLIEVFDLDSDLQVYDVLNNQVISKPTVKKDSLWETFPAFSPDGKTLYFCAAQAKPIPAEVTEIRYNLYKTSFDASTGSLGDEVEMVIDAAGQGKSISFPKPSFDGKYLMFTLSDYGNFSIWHHESDLWLLDLESGRTRPLDELNSTDTDSYHNWSSNSKWVVFSSRRDDGLYTRLYISHVNDDGTFTKPFMLPQKDPAAFYSNLMLSYNVPEFVTGPVPFDKISAQKMINSPERVQFGFRWSD